jgi:hypothetical protein
MASDLQTRLRGLVLDAVEIKNLTGWDGEMIEDYLNIFDNLFGLAGEIDTKSNILRNVTRVSFIQSPYDLTGTDEVVFFDTDDGPIVANLGAGEQGRDYRLVNVGSSGNNVTVAPNGTEKIFGETSEYMIDQESLEITFDETEGWN